MKILIAGAGSIGTILGAYLSKHHDVSLLRKISSSKTSSIKIIGIDDFTFDPKIYTKTNIQNQNFDLIFITTQAQQTDDLCSDLINSLLNMSNSIIINLQNGLNTYRKIQNYFPNNKLITGTVWWSATQINLKKTLYHRKDKTFLGIPPNSFANKQDLENIFKILSKNFEVIISNNIVKEIRTKLILNVVSPPLALTKQPYPGGLNDINIKNIVHALFDEAIEISQLIGWDLDLETNSQLNNFHKSLTNKNTFDTSNHEYVHKVSTQISMEKYGGQGSNIDELLSWMQNHGSLIADEIILLTKQQNKKYAPIDSTIFKQILNSNSYAICQF